MNLIWFVLEIDSYKLVEDQMKRAYDLISENQGFDAWSGVKISAPHSRLAVSFPLSSIKFEHC